MTKIKSDINFKGLKKLVREITKENKIRVGLLSAKGGADEVSENLDFAGLGAVQEFGATINVTDKMRKYLASRGLYLKASTKTITIPPRSFLQLPLQIKAEEIIKKTKMGYSIQEIDYSIDNEIISLYDFAVVLGANCYEVIQDAFDSGCFGEWQENHPFTLKEKAPKDRPLINTGALREKITYEVIEK